MANIIEHYMTLSSVGSIHKRNDTKLGDEHIEFIQQVESNQLFGVLAGMKSPLDANSFSNLLPAFIDRSTLLILDDD